MSGKQSNLMVQSSVFALSAALAGSLALAGTGASAQSFQGTANVVEGTAIVSQGAGTTDIVVESDSAVIDWTPTDTDFLNGVDIIFQPAGTTATFTNGSVNTNFAVLNRIVANDLSRRIVFDGTVVSQLQGMSGISPGGTVFFYSPSGILIGSNAVFDVGNLGLTTSNPQLGLGGDFIINDQVSFQQSLSGVTVEIDPSAVITASAEGSYVALFAPAIRQSGTIDVNGQAALVAAEAGTIRFSPDGLFDIEITIGTDTNIIGSTINHEGTTTGEASSGVGDNHRIYMVAVAKNTGLTLALRDGSNVGFAIAGAANVDGNAVVLSAGHDIAGGEIAATNGEVIDLLIDDTSSFGPSEGIEISSFLEARASNAANVFAGGGGLNFASDAIIRGGQVNVTANFGADMIPGNIDVQGDFILLAEGPFNGQDVGVANVTIFDGSTFTVAGNLTISSKATDDFNSDFIATGNSARLFADDASIVTIGGNLIVDAGADSSQIPGLGATGGFAQVFAQGAASINVAGVTRILSEARAGLAGTAIAGTSLLQLQAAGQFATGELNVSADAYGGDDAGNGSGSAVSGFATIRALGAQSQVTVLNANTTGNALLGELDFMSSEAFGGQGTIGNGGSATSRDINLRSEFGANITLPNEAGKPLAIRNTAIGGDAQTNGASAGAAQGGNNFITVASATADLGLLSFVSLARGGSALGGALGINGGSATGGSATINFNNSTVTVGFADLLSRTFGGDGSTDSAGGAGTAGALTLDIIGSGVTATTGVELTTLAVGGGGSIAGFARTVETSSSINNSNFDVAGNFSILTEAFGGDSNDSNGGTGGNAESSFVGLFATNSTITATGTVDVSKSATGGDAISGQAGSATTLFSLAQFNNTALNTNGYTQSNFAEGGSIALGQVGNGGNSVTQKAIFETNGGTVPLTGNLTILTESIGGAAGDLGGDGGNSQAEAATFILSNAVSADIGGSVALTTTSLGGAAAAGTGGSAQVERTEIFTFAGNLAIAGDASLQATATGGAGVTGGDSSGEITRIFIQDGSLSVTGDTLVRADFIGGAGIGTAGVSQGGTATGGPVEIFSIRSDFAFGGDVAIENRSTGGAGQTGGNAVSGDATLFVDSANVTIDGTTRLVGQGFGGNANASDTPGDGGDGTGGFVRVESRNGATPTSISMVDVFISGRAEGGDGGDANGTADGGNGGLAVGGTGFVFGNAINGTLNVTGTLDIDVTSIGGDGGTGMNGGDGGDARFGATQFGTKSGGAVPNLVEGAANFNIVTVDVSSTGGDGGTATGGTGGDGGEGRGGSASLLSRGAPVTADSIAITGTGTGGDGGAGNIVGDGGDGIASFLRATFTQAFQNPGRGSSEIETVSLISSGIGGAGANAGGSDYAIGGGIGIVQSDVDIDSFTYITNGLTPADFLVDDGMGGMAPVTVNEVRLALTNATLVSDSITMSTPGEFILVLDQSTVMSRLASLTAGTFVLEPALTEEGALSATEALSITATDGDITTGTMLASDGALDLNAANGSVLLDQAMVTAGGSLNILAANDVRLQDIAGGDVMVDAGGQLNVFNMTLAGNDLLLSSGGDTIVGALDSGGAITVVSGGNLLAENPASANRNINLTAVGNVETADLTAGGSISATSQTGQLSVFGEIDAGTDVNLTGEFGIETQSSSAGGTFTASSSGPQALGDTTANAIFANSFAGMQIDSIFTAPEIVITSPTLEFSMDGVLVAGPGGSITLNSTNADGVTVSDNTGPGFLGYLVDSDRFAKLQGGTVSIFGTDTPNPIDVTIEDFDISTNPGITMLNFGVNEGGSTPSSGIFVAGNLTASGTDTPVDVSFTSDLFELDAATGSIDLLANGGTISITGMNILIADGDTLEQLEDEELTAEEVAALLNAPAATPRPDGVLNAAGLIVDVSGTLFIQNTGTAELPAGFVTTIAGSTVTGTGGAGETLVLINGQIDTAEGRITGDEAATAIIEDFDDVEAAAFSADSQINGCDLAGCTVPVPPEEEAAITAQISSEIQVESDPTATDPAVGATTGAGTESSGGSDNSTDVDEVDDGGGDDDFEQETEESSEESSEEETEEEEAEEEAEEEEEAEAAASGPIAPPVSLINTSSIDARVDVTDPVSSAGNPALLDAETQTTPPAQEGPNQ